MDVQGHYTEQHNTLVESNVWYLMTDAQNSRVKLLQQCYVTNRHCWSTDLTSVMRFLRHNS